MHRLIKTDSSNRDFADLVNHLDAELAIRDGAEHSFYHQFNKIRGINHVILLYAENEAVACGAIKDFDQNSAEIKRMYTMPELRGKGLAVLVLLALEQWAAEMGYKKCILETGKKQPEAIALYQKCGYSAIPNYGQYAGVENSVCFEKQLG